MNKEIKDKLFELGFKKNILESSDEIMYKKENFDSITIYEYQDEVTLWYNIDDKLDEAILCNFTIENLKKMLQIEKLMQELYDEWR